MRKTSREKFVEPLECRRYLSTLSGIVYLDYNADGVHGLSEQVRIAGATIYADLNEDGVRQPTEPFTQSDSTVGNYNYRLNVPGGREYVLRAVFPAGYTGCTPAQGYYRLFIPANTIIGGDYDFGAWTPGTVSGRVYFDRNRDRVANAGEPPVAEWTVYADMDSSGSLDEGEPSVVTGAGGVYRFENN